MQRKAYSGRYGLSLEVCSNTWNRLGESCWSHCISFDLRKG